MEITLMKSLVNDLLLLDESESYKKLILIRANSFKRSLSYKKKRR